MDPRKFVSVWDNLQTKRIFLILVNFINRKYVLLTVSKLLIMLEVNLFIVVNENSIFHVCIKKKKNLGIVRHAAFAKSA